MVENQASYDQISNPILVWQRKNTGNTTMPVNHYHDAYEIYYLLEGIRYYFIKDRTYHISKGDLVFININDLHKTLDAGAPSHERILINFKKDFLKNLVDDSENIDLLSFFKSGNHVIRLSITDQTFVENLLSKMVLESKKQTVDAIFYQKLLLSELLLFMTRTISQLKQEAFEYPNNLHKKISEIAQYVNSNYASNLTLKHISEHFYISPHYFSRSFKEVTGFTFIEYLNRIRTKEAQRLLTESKLNVSQIAEKMGYESITHFGRVFKSITGLSPLKYRKLKL